MVQQMSFKSFLSGALAVLLFWWSQNIYAILKEGITWNIRVALYGIWTSDSGGDVV